MIMPMGQPHRQRAALFRGNYPLLLVGLLVSVANLSGQAGGYHTEYYRDEDSFRRGINLFPFEVHEDHYLKVVIDESAFVREMLWYTPGDSLLKIRYYEYDPADGSLRRMVELTPDSLVLRKVLFGDEAKSREFLEYFYGIEFVKDYRDRFTEVFYDSTQRPTAYRIMSTRGKLVGAVFLDYDSLGYLVNETWFQGEEMQRIRELRYIFHRDTRVQEVIERGREGQVVSHVRIKTDPKRVTAPGLSLGVEVVPDTAATRPN